MGRLLVPPCSDYWPTADPPKCLSILELLALSPERDRSQFRSSLQVVTLVLTPHPHCQKHPKLTSAHFRVHLVVGEPLKSESHSVI